MILPLNDPKITSEYGIIRSDGKLHKGLDFISTIGDRNVKAIKAGKVSYVGFDANGFGNYVSIHQGDDLRALYCHLKSASVKKGDLIEAGQIIGIEGSTGNSTGVHLHLEIRKSPYKTNDHINVADYMKIENKKGVIKMPEKRYNNLEDVPSYAKQTIEKLINNEFLKGDEKGNLDLSKDMIRLLVIMDRAKLFESKI